LKTGAKTLLAGVATAVGTIVVQRIVVVLRLAGADGWGTAGLDLETAGQVETLPETGQHTHTAALAELGVTAVGAIVVQRVAVTDEVEVVEDSLELRVDVGAETVGDDVANLKRPKGLIMFPSASILLSSSKLLNFHLNFSRHWRFIV
jgi:hypothetical protein